MNNSNNPTPSGLGPSGPVSACDETRKTLHELWFDGREFTDERSENIATRTGSTEGPVTSIHARQSAPATDSEETAEETRRLEPVDPMFLKHLTKCAACRDEAQQLRELGTSLRSGFQALGRDAHSAMEPRIASTLETLEEPAGGMFRRLRRGFRLVFFITVVALISLGFMAGCLLAMRLWKALASNL